MKSHIKSHFYLACVPVFTFFPQKKHGQPSFKPSTSRNNTSKKYWRISPHDHNAPFHNFELYEQFKKTFSCPYNWSKISFVLSSIICYICFFLIKQFCISFLLSLFLSLPLWSNLPFSNTLFLICYFFIGLFYTHSIIAFGQI